MEPEPVAPQQSFSLNQYTPPQRSSKKGLKRFILLFIVFLGILVFGITRFVSSRNVSKTQVAPTSIITPTEELFPTDTPAVTETPSPTPKPSVSPTTNPKDKATGLDRSYLTIEVQNGSGTVGVASKASDFLKNLGYVVSGTANADAFTYEQTVIKVKSEKKEYLPLLKKDLGSSYSIGETSESLSASTSADAIVIVGKQ